jgi:hypothetical protein
MHGVAAIVWLALLAAGCATIYVTAERLPPRVASHFNFEGFANGSMPRDDYLLLMLLLTVVLPAVMVALNVLLPRVAPRLLRIPAHDHWLAAERRDETYASMGASGFVVASMVTAFTLAVHLLMVEANARRPPRPDSASVWILIGALWLPARLRGNCCAGGAFVRPRLRDFGST